MKNINIKFNLKEIIYDIQNKTYLTGKSRRDGANHEKVANMQANDDDENANQILRSVTMAFSTLKTRLGEYVDETVNTVTNKSLNLESELELTLRMPSNYNCATAETMAAAAHQYIVAFAIADWFTITDKEDAKDYTLLSDTSLKVMEEAVNKRVRPVRATES